MATVNQDPNQPTLDAIDQMFNGLRSVSPFNDIGSIVGAEVPQEMDPGNGQIQPVGFIGQSALDGLEIFADDIRPVAVVTSLPTLPDALYPLGSFVFLTSDGKLYRNPDDVAWSRTVDGADIIADSITAGSIAAGAIGADQLASNIILGGLIVAGTPSAAHLELDTDGLRSYDSSLGLLLNAPTDGSPLYVNAEVEAGSLTVTGNAVLQGSGNSIEQGGIMALQALQQPPSQAPTLAQDWDSVTMEAPTYKWQNLDYDSAGGAGGATKVFWTFEQDGFGGYTVTELKASDRTTNRQMASDLATELASHGVDTTGLVAYGICKHSTYVYVLVSTNPAPTFATSWGVARYNKSDLTFNTFYGGISMPLSASASQHPRICSDGTNPYIVDKGTGTGTVKWCKYNDTMVKQGSTQDTGHSPASGAMIRDAAAGTFDFGGSFRLLISTDADQVYSYDVTPSVQVNEQFPIPSDTAFGGGFSYGDALGDGARFWSFKGASGSQTTLTKHSTWTWTSASSIYWVAYAWYDSAGTTHETTVSPRASITMGRRKRLTVTTQATPGAGGADEPNSRRVYMVPKSTAPATTELKLQATSTPATAVLTTYDSGGAAPSATNTFPNGTAAEIKSATAGWSIKGDGTFQFKQVGHLMFKNSNQSISTGGTFTKVATYDGTVRTNAAFFSNTTGVITLLQAGLYQIVCQGAWAANATGQRLLGVGLNGADPINRNRVSQNANGAGGTHQSFTMFLDAAVNDTVQMMCQQTSGGNLNFTDGIFQILWLGT